MDLLQRWEIAVTCNYITSNDYTRVALQFPDDLLFDSPVVADALQTYLQQQGSAAKVYVLADTSYNPLSVDEVAAAHINADCVVHYGYASLNPVSHVPAYCVLPKLQLDVQQAAGWVAEQLAQLQDCNSSSTRTSSGPVYEGRRPSHELARQHSSNRPLAVFCCDQGYMHVLPQLKQAVLAAYQGPYQLVFADSAPVQLVPQGSLATAPGPKQKPNCGSGSKQKVQDCGCDSGCEHHSEPPLHQQQQAQEHQQSPASCSDCSCSSRELQQQQVSGAAAAAAAAAEPHAQGHWLPPIGGLAWQLPSRHCSSSSPSNTAQQQEQQEQPMMVWLGSVSSPALTHLQLTYSTHSWLLLDPSSQSVCRGLTAGLDRLLMRRRYLVERARAASMVGLLVGTLGAAGYLTALQQLRSLAAQVGKKTYTLLMGKPNPAKLANFPELEVFVMLSDPGGLVLDCKEYLQPIITPHEAFLAFTGQALDAASYRLDFGDLLQLQQQQHEQQDRAQQTAGAAGAAAPADGVSSMRCGSPAGGADDSDGKAGGSDQQQLAVPDRFTGGLAAGVGALVIAGSSQTAVQGAGSRTGQQVQVHSAAQYLSQHRTYRGLETPATGAEIKAAELAVEGRSGRAAGYVDEPPTVATS